MEITDEILERVSEYASAMMSVREVAILLGMTAEEYSNFRYAISHYPEDSLSKTYLQSRLQQKLALRASIVKLALKGSPAAQPIAEKYLAELPLDES